MNLIDLCEMICLPEQMTGSVLEFASDYDEKSTESLSAVLDDPSQWENGVKEIARVLGEDPDGSKMLTIMLLCAVDSHKEYKKRGINDAIFTDTMKFCTRFVEEHHKLYGTYAFKWAWWFPRQLSLREFRIGALEYEMIEREKKKWINIHIPADASMGRERLRESYEDARAFFTRYFPDYGQSDMMCDSWLLSPHLTKLLPESSNILGFQRAFELVHVDETNDSFIRWVFGRTDIPVRELREDTSLQRKIKACLLEGSNLGAATGRLQEDPWKES